MYYQQGNTEMGAHQDGLQTLYLMNPNNNYISYTAADTQSQFMGNIIPQSQQDHDHHHHHHQHSINNIQQHGSLWGLAAADQQQTPKGLSLSLGDDDPSVFQGRLMINDDHEVDVKSSVIMGSKYLKAAHELLDEVVSVVVVDKQAKPTKMMITKEVDDHNNNKNNCGPQLTSAQRQEFLIKKTKLNSMLDEVEQRYKQYQQQMQMMVTSFQQVAGNGSAKTYTQLALKTILKQFRCLKNTISSQLKALCKTLGEEEENDEEYRNSRLKFVDHDHLRQQRTLQQLGMMQNNNNNNNNSAWRPQRGLPEPAVSVLRAWLFEHFLHPYPKDSDKHTLAKQTGLTRSQVSNWFINARVRLWKPMVEDMYLEEIKNQETVPGDDTTKHGPHTSESNSKPSNPRQANNKPEISASTVITKSPTRDYTDYPNNNNPKKPRNENSPRSMLSVDMESDRTIISKGFNDNITLISANPGQNMENYLSSSGFSDGYGISVGGSGFQGNNININSNSNNNNFSLTLALPPSGNYSQGTQLQNFRNFEFGTRIEPVVESNDRVDHGINNRPDGSHPNNGHYEILDFQNRKLPFSSRLIPDHHFLT